jgi:two-component system, OmpR family, sensor histidine kinase KdpD
LLVRNNMPMPKTPEQWLDQVTAAEQPSAAVLKLFLGYAPGVGKTYNMLSEGIRRHSRGEDVVIGVVETHGRERVAELAAQLEKVPARKLEYKGATFEEMDVDAILARHPQVALVDELAHTNVEGSKHRKRYEDVIELMDAGIKVLSTMNIQHLEGITPTVQNITGITVRETVPDWVLERVSEIVMVDLTPEALQARMQRGDIYPSDRIERALGNFFRRGNLIALRELALRRVAETVDRSLDDYQHQKDIQANWGVRERIAVCISEHPSSQHLIARGARMARAMDGELYCLHVETGRPKTDQDLKALAAHFAFAENLGATVVQVKGDNVAEGAIRFVHDRRITHIVFGRSLAQGWRRWLFFSSIHRFLRASPSVDVHIVSHDVA